MNNEITDSFPPQLSRPYPNSGRELICSEYDNYADYPPEDLELEDVEYIFWTVSSYFSNKQIRFWFYEIAKSMSHLGGCWSYIPIADGQRRGRYPRSLPLLLKQVFGRKGAIVKYENKYLIQIDLWHEVINVALSRCPTKSLPPHLVRVVRDRAAPADR